MVAVKPVGAPPVALQIFVEEKLHSLQEKFHSMEPGFQEKRNHESTRICTNGRATIRKSFASICVNSRFNFCQSCPPLSSLGYAAELRCQALMRKCDLPGLAL